MSISPLDGRYAERLQRYRCLQGEHALMQARLQVECAWLETLADCPQFPTEPLSPAASAWLQGLVNNFGAADFDAIKDFEARSRHDVKAVEYYLAERCSQHPELSSKVSLIHFACTSEDINNLAYALLTQRARSELLSGLGAIASALAERASSWAGVAMLARTHGQSATPTTLGKEFANFHHRLRQQMALIADLPISAKCNGATGNYNAHRFACPEVDWQRLSRKLVADLGLEFNPYSTQIEPHDSLANLLNAVGGANSILLDCCRDCWAYISMGYLRQRVGDQSEVGSSTMPHKVNPIDFENAEGNLGVANALLTHLAQKLPISRLQRDLSDSTALRNLTPAFAHSLLAYDSILAGCAKVEADPGRIGADLDEAWELLAEPIQTMMRLHGISDAYEQLKGLSRGRTLSREQLHDFIRKLPIPARERERLLELRPATYLGDAEQLALACGHQLQS